MRKNIFQVLAFAAVMVMSGCGDGGNTPIDATGISIRQGSELSMVEGDKVKLVAKLEPQGAAGIIRWTSSDSTVVTPSRTGLIKAVSEGEATIKATCNGHSASIKVTVTPYWDAVKFTGAFIMSRDEDPITDEVFHVYSKVSKDTTYCRKYWAEIWLCSENLFVSDEAKIVANPRGTAMEIRCPIYYGDTTLNPGAKGSVIFSLGRYRVSDDAAYSDTTVHICRPGRISDEEDFFNLMETFCNQYNQYLSTDNAQDYRAAFDYIRDANELVTGAKLMTYDYLTVEDDGVENDGLYYYNLGSMPDALVDSAFFCFNANGISNYMYGLDFSYVKAQMFDGIYGCDIRMGSNNRYSLYDHEIHTTVKEFQTGEPREEDEEEKADAPRVLVGEVLPLRTLDDMPMMKYVIEKRLRGK